MFKTTANFQEVRDFRIESVHDVKFRKTPYPVYTLFYTKVSPSLYYYPAKFNPNIKLKTHEEKLTELWLRWYQLESVLYTKDYYSTLLVSWTGTGKSHMIKWLCELYKDYEIIVLAPKLKVLQTLKPKLEWYKITLISTAMFSRHYDRFNKEWTILIMDEIQHMSKKKIDEFNMRKGYKIIWLTATPQRQNFWREWFNYIFQWYFDTEQQALPVTVWTFSHTISIWVKDLLKLSEWLAPDSPELRRRVALWDDQRYEVLYNLLTNFSSKRVIVFVDRIEIMKKAQAYFESKWKLVYTVYSENSNIPLENDLEKYTDYIIVAMTQCVQEWRDVPQLELWVLFYNTTWVNAIEQMVWRVRRYHWEKKSWLWIDFNDRIKLIENKQTRYGWLWERKKLYKELWREVIDLQHKFNAIWLKD